MHLEGTSKPQIFSCKVAWSFDTYQQMREVSLVDTLDIQKKKIFLLDQDVL